MRPEAANIDADTERGIRKWKEWFAKHSRDPQREGFFDAAYEDESPGRCPTSRLLRKYANFADALKGFRAIRPSRRMPAELEGKTWVDICREWDSRREATQAWENLRAAEHGLWAAIELFESKRRANPDVDAGGDPGDDSEMVLAQNRLKETEAAYAASRGAEILPMERATLTADSLRRKCGALVERVNKSGESLAEAKGHGSLARSVKTLESRSLSLRERAERAKVKWQDGENRKQHQKLIDRWEAVIVAREPLQTMIDALGPDRTDYESAEKACLDWERESANQTGRMSIRADHPDPRSRASWEIRRWVLPLRYAYSDPRRFFTEIAPQYDSQEFDPQSLWAFEKSRYPGALAECLREWGFGALLHPTVRAAFDAAAQDSRVFGEMLAMAERKTTFPQEGSQGKRKRQKRVKPLAERMNHWLGIFKSKNTSGRRRQLAEKGISLEDSKRLPTIEGCALRVCAKELGASLDAIRKQRMREKMDTKSK